jgi:hypothetical protein
MKALGLKWISLVVLGTALSFAGCGESSNLVFFGMVADLVGAGVIEGIDDTKCQMVSTFTRYGKTIGDPGHHGEPGALLSATPSNTWEAGPVYFNDDVEPDAAREYSSLDGGVVILNAEPGEYTLSASCVEDPGLMDAFVAEYPPRTTWIRACAAKPSTWCSNRS